MSSSLDEFHDVITVELVGEYILRLGFDDGTSQIVDFEPMLIGPIFGPLRDENEFAQVKVNRDTGTIEWPNGADFSPEILYDWEEYGARVIAERRERYSIKS